MRSHLVLLGLITFGSVSLASDIKVWGRAYDYSCGYFSRRAADISLTFYDAKLPWGTEVNAIVGFQGEYPMGGWMKTVNWEDRTVVAAKSINTSTWEAKISDKTLHSRTEGRFLSKVQFVFEIKVPGQAPKYVNGGGTWGYFETELLNPGTSCVSGSSGLPPWRELGFRAVEKE